jgi:hypothetical protein
MINHPNRRRATKPRVVSSDHDRDYSALLASVHRSFAASTASGARLFCTDAAGLNDLYLDNLPDERQTHNCHACRRFIETFGALVTIDEAGDTAPVMWNDPPEFYAPAFSAMAKAIKRAKVTGPFLTKADTWGTPQTGAWTHMHVNPARSYVYREGALTAGQAMAAQRENTRIVGVALGEFKPAALDQAIRILSADALDRSERFLAPVQWLRALHDRPKGQRGTNVLWREVASAPDGYCHPRASMTGTLLEDIEAGMDFDTIATRWRAKMHPLQYQRPQAAPTAGNIAAAEALVAKLGIARSLDRRFARLDEIETIWRPAPAEAQAATGGVFGHLKPKGAVAPSVALPSATMTWDKFTRTVLPTAERIEFNVPTHGDFMAFLTAQHADAPPIIKWGNSVSSYVYHGGSAARIWGLSPGWVNVTGIALRSNLWGAEPRPEFGIGAMVILQGAVDSRDNQGNALFPEILRADLRGARASIEAYSRTAQIGGRAEASACGHSVNNKGALPQPLRVLTAGAWREYRIDRWD